MGFRILFFQIVFIFSSSLSVNADTVDVEIYKSTFIPSVVKVKKGDTIKWVNKEEVLHTVTSGKAPIHDEKFNAPFLVKEFQVKIDEPSGVIDYFCAIHNATMRGVIVVEDKP